MTDEVTLNCHLSKVGTPTGCRATNGSRDVDAYRAEALARGARLEPATYADFPQSDVWVRFTTGPTPPAHDFRVEVGD